jgi:predicted transcriptional regulator
MPRLGITVYLPPDIEAQVLRVAKARNLSASGVIANAVKTLFADNPNGVPEGVTRQLARVEARLNKATRDTAILNEALFMFVRIWLVYNPELEEGVEEASLDADQARFDLYLDHVRNGLEPQGSITGDWESGLAPGEQRR